MALKFPTVPPQASTASTRIEEYSEEHSYECFKARIEQAKNLSEKSVGQDTLTTIAADIIKNTLHHQYIVRLINEYLLDQKCDALLSMLLTAVFEMNEFKETRKNIACESREQVKRLIKLAGNDAKNLNGLGALFLQMNIDKMYPATLFSYFIRLNGREVFSKESLVQYIKETEWGFFEFDSYARVEQLLAILDLDVSTKFANLICLVQYNEDNPQFHQFLPRLFCDYPRLLDEYIKFMPVTLHRLFASKPFVMAALGDKKSVELLHRYEKDARTGGGPISLISGIHEDDSEVQVALERAQGLVWGPKNNSATVQTAMGTLFSFIPDELSAIVAPATETSSPTTPHELARKVITELRASTAPTDLVESFNRNSLQGYLKSASPLYDSCVAEVFPTSTPLQSLKIKILHLNLTDFAALAEKMPKFMKAVFATLSDQELLEWCITYNNGIGPLPSITVKNEFVEYIQGRFKNIRSDVLVSSGLIYRTPDPIRADDLGHLFEERLNEIFGIPKRKGASLNLRFSISNHNEPQAIVKRLQMSEVLQGGSKAEKLDLEKLATNQDFVKKLREYDSIIPRRAKSGGITTDENNQISGVQVCLQEAAAVGLIPQSPSYEQTRGLLVSISKILWPGKPFNQSNIFEIKTKVRQDAIHLRMQLKALFQVEALKVQQQNIQCESYEDIERLLKLAQGDPALIGYLKPLFIPFIRDGRFHLFLPRLMRDYPELVDETFNLSNPKLRRLRCENDADVEYLIKLAGAKTKLLDHLCDLLIGDQKHHHFIPKIINHFLKTGDQGYFLISRSLLKTLFQDEKLKEQRESIQYETFEEIMRLIKLAEGNSELLSNLKDLFIQNQKYHVFIPQIINHFLKTDDKDFSLIGSMLFKALFQVEALKEQQKNIQCVNYEEIKRLIKLAGSDKGLLSNLKDLFIRDQKFHYYLLPLIDLYLQTHDSDYLLVGSALFQVEGLAEKQLQVGGLAAKRRLVQYKKLEDILKLIREAAGNKELLSHLKDLLIGVPGYHRFIPQIINHYLQTAESDFVLISVLLLKALFEVDALKEQQQNIQCKSDEEIGRLIELAQSESALTGHLKQFFINDQKYHPFLPRVMFKHPELIDDTFRLTNPALKLQCESYENLEHLLQLAQDKQELVSELKKLFIQNETYHPFLPQLIRKHPEVIDNNFHLFNSALPFLSARKRVLELLKDPKLRELHVKLQKNVNKSQKSMKEISLRNLGPLEIVYKHYQHDLEVCSVFAVYKLDEYIRPLSFYDQAQIAIIRDRKPFSADTVQRLYVDPKNKLDDTQRAHNLIIGIERFTKGQSSLTCEIRKQLIALINAADKVADPAANASSDKVVPSSQAAASSDSRDTSNNVVVGTQAISPRQQAVKQGAKPIPRPVTLVGRLLSAIIDDKEFNKGGGYSLYSGSNISVLVGIVLNQDVPNADEAHVFNAIEHALQNPETNRAILKSEAAKSFTPQQLARLAELDSTGRTGLTLTNVSLWERVTGLLGIKSPSTILESADGESLARVVIADPNGKAAAQVFARPELVRKFSGRDLVKIVCANKKFLNELLQNTKGCLEKIRAEIKKQFSTPTIKVKKEATMFQIEESGVKQTLGLADSKLSYTGKEKWDSLGLETLLNVLNIIATETSKKQLVRSETYTENVEYISNLALERFKTIAEYYRNTEISSDSRYKAVEIDFAKCLIRFCSQETEGLRELIKLILGDESCKVFLRKFFRTYMPVNKDYYEILGVQRQATKEKIEGSLADTTRKDVLDHADEIRRILLNDEERKKYDASLEFSKFKLDYSLKLIMTVLKIYANDKEKLKSYLLDFIPEANKAEVVENMVKSAEIGKIITPRSFEVLYDLYLKDMFESKTQGKWLVRFYKVIPNQNRSLREFIERKFLELDAERTFAIFQLNDTDKLLRGSPEFLITTYITLSNAKSSNLAYFTSRVLAKCLESKDEEKSTAFFDCLLQDPATTKKFYQNVDADVQKRILREFLARNAVEAFKVLGINDSSKLADLDPEILMTTFLALQAKGQDEKLKLFTFDVLAKCLMTTEKTQLRILLKNSLFQEVLLKEPKKLLQCKLLTEFQYVDTQDREIGTTKECSYVQLIRHAIIALNDDVGTIEGFIKANSGHPIISSLCPIDSKTAAAQEFNKLAAKDLDSPRPHQSMPPKPSVATGQSDEEGQYLDKPEPAEAGHTASLVSS